MPSHLSLPILDHVVHHVIQHFISSYLLLDFFSNCYDVLNKEEEDPAKQTLNNEIAILAIQGLFLLIYHHNKYVFQ